jgi:hypothetical protein
MGVGSFSAKIEPLAASFPGPPMNAKPRFGGFDGRKFPNIAVFPTIADFKAIT